MIHTLRKLARGIHRRSVWQVLAVYVLMSLVALSAVSVLTDLVGLPQWTFSMALVLLLIGLPVVLATAVAQGGLPGLRIEDYVDPNELEGLTPEQVHVIPEAHPLHDTRLFTWRNAILGGVMAAALLVGSVTAYFTMWSFGIGPVGSLIAQGVLNTRDAIVLADFENLTDDAGLGAVVTEAFRIDLNRSEAVSVLGEERVTEALGVMGQIGGAALSGGAARAVATSMGAPAFVVGSVARGRNSYILRASVLRSDNGQLLASFSESASGDSDLIATVGVLGQKIRERIGESLRSIRADPPLTAVTSSSLPAMKRYTEALHAEGEGDYARALSLLEDALAMDPDFPVAEELLAEVSERVGA